MLPPGVPGFRPYRPPLKIPTGLILFRTSFRCQVESAQERACNPPGHGLGMRLGLIVLHSVDADIFRIAGRTFITVINNRR